MPLKDMRNGKGSLEWYMDEMPRISQDPELTQKEKLTTAIIGARIEYVFRLLILIPFAVPFEWIFDEVAPTIGKTASTVLGMIVFLLFTIPCMSLSLVLTGLYCLGEGLMFPFVALYAVIKDAIAARQDYTIQTVSRSEVKVAYLFRHFIFNQPFDQIEDYVDTLDLSSNQFNEKPLSEVLTLLKSIPSHIRHLNLANNGLCNPMSTADLQQVYKAIPHHLSSLDLSENRFPDVSLFCALPQTLSTFKLNGCNLTYQQLAPLLSILPEILSTLELARNPDLLSFNHPMSLVSFVSKKLKVILSDNLFTQGNSVTPRVSVPTATGQIHISVSPFSQGQRTQFFSLLDDKTTALDFRRSNFFEHLDEDLVLPEKLTELGINLSVLHAQRFHEGARKLKLNSAKLESMKLHLDAPQSRLGWVQAIPTSVNTLDLSHNRLGCFKIDDLVSLVRYLPEHITTLNLNHNELGKLKADELLRFLSSLPTHIRVIHLDHNGLFHGCKTIAEADAFFEQVQHALPVSCSTAPKKWRPVKPMVHLNTGNGYSLTSQFGLLLMPRNTSEVKGKLHTLPYMNECNARPLVYQFLGGRGELQSMDSFLEPVLKHNPVPKPALV